jgi:hypothetical protein
MEKTSTGSCVVRRLLYLVFLALGVAIGAFVEYKILSGEPKAVAAQESNKDNGDAERIQKLQQEKALLMNEVTRLQARLEGSKVGAVAIPPQPKEKQQPTTPVATPKFGTAKSAQIAP